MSNPGLSKYSVANVEDEFKTYMELPNNNPLAIIDTGMQIAYCNDTFKNFFGIQASHDVLAIQHNPEFINLVKGFGESKYKNIALDINLFSATDPVIKNYLVSLERVFLRAGQFYVVAIESLIQRQQLENKINALHNALDHGNLPIVILDSYKKITYATRSFEELLSKEIDSIYYKDPSDILSDTLSESEIEELQHAMDNFISWKKLIPFIKKSPVKYWEFAMNPVISNEGLQTNYILMANDLTDYINQKKAVERSERKQRLIIDNISDLLLIVENIGTQALFENANDNFCRIFGLDKDKISSRKIDDFLSADLSLKIYESINALTVNNVPYQQYSFRDPESRHYSCKISSIEEQELGSTFYIITMKDITDEVLYREQLKKAFEKEMLLNRMKSDFLANMSHEIRTPFNAIVGFSEILDDCIHAGDVESIMELMDSMKEVLGRVVNLFTNIVEVFQLEAGEVELDKVDLNCNQVIRNVYQKMYSEASKKNLQFILKVDENDCMVETDWVKFEKVVLLLMDNAIKYTHNGYVSLSSKNWGDRVEIIISDSGQGIEDGEIERLLQPFTQEVEGYTRPFEGAGLGLALAYKLTKLLDGRFVITSEKNKGTTISLTFDLSN